MICCRRRSSRKARLEEVIRICKESEEKQKLLEYRACLARDREEIQELLEIEGKEDFQEAEVLEKLPELVSDSDNEWPAREPAIGILGYPGLTRSKAFRGPGAMSFKLARFKLGQQWQAYMKQIIPEFKAQAFGTSPLELWARLVEGRLLAHECNTKSELLKHIVRKLREES